MQRYIVADASVYLPAKVPISPFAAPLNTVHTSNCFKRELLEGSKIVVMTTALAITYDIVQGLIITRIGFDYFNSDRTHHGPVTRAYFPYVYRKNSRVLYALLWGTIAIWWVWLSIGLGMGSAGRYGTCKVEETWSTLLKPTAVFMAALLASTLFTGAVTYRNTGDNFHTVASMHNAAYAIGVLGGIGLMCYVYWQRKRKGDRPISISATGISIHLDKFGQNALKPDALPLYQVQAHQ